VFKIGDKVKLKSFVDERMSGIGQESLDDLMGKTFIIHKVENKDDENEENINIYVGDEWVYAVSWLELVVD